MEQSTKDKVAETVGTAKEKTAEQAGQVTERGRGVVREQLGQRSMRLGDQVGSTSQTLRQVADQARSQGNDQQARLAEQAADRADRLSSYLVEADPDEMLQRVEDMARRQPWLVAGAGALVGFTLARALKVSSSQRYETRYGDRDSLYSTGYTPTPQITYGRETWADDQTVIAPSMGERTGLVEEELRQ